MNGKGSQPRPKSVPYNQYSDNWDKIFGKKKKKAKIEEFWKKEAVQLSNMKYENDKDCCLISLSSLLREIRQ